jgi:hypothetical protein
MKILLRALDGFWSGGKLIAPGETVELEAQDALDALATGRALCCHGNGAVANARAEANRECMATLNRREW